MRCSLRKNSVFWCNRNKTFFVHNKRCLQWARRVLSLGLQILGKLHLTGLRLLISMALRQRDDKINSNVFILHANVVTIRIPRLMLVFQVSVSFSQNKCRLLFFVSEDQLKGSYPLFLGYGVRRSVSLLLRSYVWIVFNWNMAKLRIKFEQLDVTSISVSMFQFCSMAEFDLEFK